MATPTIARFSVLPQTPLEMLRALTPILPPLQTRIQAAGRLSIDIEGEMSFTGEEVPCETVDDAARIAKPWGDFAVSFRAAPPNQDVFIYFWKRDDSWNMSVELPSPVLFFESDGLQSGQWARAFLLAVAAASRVAVGAFGRSYGDTLYEPIDVTLMLKKLREGELFGLRGLFLHLFSSTLVKTEEMQKLLSQFKHEKNFRYCLTATGYHVFDTLSHEK